MGDLFGPNGVTAEKFNQCAAMPVGPDRSVNSAITGMEYYGSGKVDVVRIDTAQIRNDDQDSIQTYIDLKKDKVTTSDTGIGAEGLRAQAASIRRAISCLHPKP